MDDERLRSTGFSHRPLRQSLPREMRGTVGAGRELPALGEVPGEHKQYGSEFARKIGERFSKLPLDVKSKIVGSNILKWGRGLKSNSSVVLPRVHKGSAKIIKKAY